MLQVLKEMNMDKYSTSFAQEQISGEILSQCDDQVLLEELQITSKVHRIRLLSLIQGHSSARSLLDPYVKCFKNQ